MAHVGFGASALLAADTCTAALKCIEKVNYYK